MSEPLMPEREQEIRETQLGNWYDGPWTQGYVEGAGDDPAYYRVKHAESGTTLATLPDWAGPIALFIADAHDAVPELLAELDRVRAERDQYATQLDGLHLAQWEEQQEAAESDTLPAWLYQRFMPDGTGWENLDDDQRSYWKHQARAVRRAVARNGFKAEGGGR
jgi:hypothetical protein